MFSFPFLLRLDAKDGNFRQTQILSFLSNDDADFFGFSGV